MRILVSELPPPLVRAIERRMRPGRLSRNGFLDKTERLIDVIDSDLELLDKVGVTPEQVADRLETVVSQAFRVMDLLGRSRTKDDKESQIHLWDTGVRIGPWELRGTSYHGYQDCPFVDADGVVCPDINHADYDFSLINIRMQRFLAFPGLAIHLIREHHFFEGHVPHRVDPLLACEVLEIESGKDYSPRWTTEHVWRQCFGTGETPEQWRNVARDEHLCRVVDNPESVVPVEPDGQLHFRGDTCVAISNGSAWVPTDLEVNGARWVEPQLWIGVSAFRRVANRYVEPEQLSDCIVANSSRSGSRSLRKSIRTNRRVGLPIPRVEFGAGVRSVLDRLMDVLPSPSRRRVIDDATFGRLTYSDYDSIWYGRWRFPPSGTTVAISLPGDRHGPLPGIKDFFKELPDRFESILSSVRPRLDEIFRRWLRRPISDSLWDDLELVRFSVEDPEAQPPEWSMHFELADKDCDEEDEEDEWLEITVFLSGDSREAAIVYLDSEASA
jgi:hypothetical protein